MINKFEIHGVHMHIDPKLYAYTSKKIGRLDRFIPRKMRDAIHCEVFLKEQKLKAKKNNICEVVMQLPQETITTKESTVNMYAAVDIVEAKLKNRLKKYKDTHSHQRIHKRLISRIKKGRA